MQLTNPWSGRPEKLGRAILLILAVAAACALWGGVLAELIGIAFGGAVIAFLLSPLMRRMERHFPRPAAAGLTLALAAGALLGLAALLLPALARQFAALAKLLPEGIERLQSLLVALAERLRRRVPGLALPEFDFSAMDGALAEAARRAAAWIAGFGGRVYRFALMAAMSCFYLADRDRVLLRLELLVPLRWRRVAVRAGNMLLRDLKLYLRGQAAISLAVGALAALGFLLIGLPGAPLLGLLVGALNVVPYLGPFLGGVPAVVSALSAGWERALLTLAVLLGVQQIDGMVISPRVMGSVTGFSPAVVLLALFAGAEISGVAGLLFALPALMAARCLYRACVQRNDAVEPRAALNNNFGIFSEKAQK